MKQTAQIPTTHQKGGMTCLSLAFDADSDGWFLSTHTEADHAASEEFWHMTKEDALAQAKDDFGVNESIWSSASAEKETSAKTLDANGTQLQDGDTITLIKDLDVKGANTTLKRGTTIKNIRLTNDPAEIDCPSAPIRGLVLKSCFVKKL